MPATPKEKLWSQLVREEALAEFDRHWAALLARLDPAAGPNLLLTAALARFAIEQGHVCLDLADPAAWWPPAATAAGYPPPKTEELQAELRRSPLVATPGVAPDSQPAPMVLARNRLYLWRYWQYEEELAAAILQRAVPMEPEPDLPRAEKRLTDLAAAAGLELDGDQRAAVLGALKHHLTVISGGPGTGKTTIIYFILKLLREPDGAKPRILLLAPTGKAAARLGETLREQQEEGLAAMTIHRALGYQADTPTTFRHGREQPLAADLVVVDEASMVDMALMSKLLAAVPPTARLVLLGDKDQLASVEAGSILGDIFRAAARLGPCLINLRRGFRFDPGRGIGALVQGIKAGDPAAVLAVPVSRPEEGSEVTLNAAADPETQADFQALVLQGFRPCLTAASPAEALARLNDFRLLCAHRRGPAGVEGLNRFCRELLTGASLLEPLGLTAGDDEWYRGRPILVVANSYEARLFNGDLGIIWDDPEAAGELLAFFPAAGGGLRRLPPGRLPRHETAFAMTIHKSQGSEFERVAVILPREDSPLLSRELLYTAVSRARRQVHLFGPEAAIARALARRVTRTSGLAAALAGPGGSGAEEV